MRPPLAEALEIDVPVVFEFECVADRLPEFVAHLNATRNALALHTRRYVHRIAPEVVADAGVADHARDHRAAMQTDPQRQLPTAERRTAVSAP